MMKDIENLPFYNMTPFSKKYGAPLINEQLHNIFGVTNSTGNH